MLEGIQQTIDSYFPEDFTYYQEKTAQFLDETVLASLPFVMTAAFVLKAAHVMLSRILYDCVTKENTEEMAERIFYAKHKFSKGFSEEEKWKTALAFKKHYQQRLESRLNQIDLLSKKMDIKDITLAIDFNDDTMYQAVGDHLTINTLIVIGMNSENKTEISVPVLEIPNSPELTKISDFILAHEMAHIKNCDFTVRFLSTIVQAFANAFIWSTPYGLFSRALFAFGSQMAFKVLDISINKFQETRADKNAINALKTNEGAVLFFSLMQNNPRDLSHPSNTERLQAAKNWKVS